jgi:hypothetical protein
MDAATAVADAPAVTLPELTIDAPAPSQGGNPVEPVTVTDEIRALVAKAYAAHSAESSAYAVLVFDAEHGGAEACDKVVKQVQAACAGHSPQLRVRRKTVYMPDPQDAQYELPNPQVYKFRITLAPDPSGRKKAGK